MIQIAHGWALDVERGPDWLIVRPHVLIAGADDTPDLADEVWGLLEQNFTRRLVLELDGLDHLNSHLIGQLVRLHKRICTEDGTLRICGLSIANQRVLDQCRLSGRVPCFASRTDAVLGPRPAQPR